MKVLVLASERVPADRLRLALGETTDRVEIMVVAPTLHRSALRFWLSDSDEATQRARHVQRATVEGLCNEGLDARGDIGEGTPVKAVEDALRGFVADRIVVFSRPPSEQRYAEAIEVDALRSRFGVPVQRVDRER
jgi:uncharacterized membrane protein